MYDPAQKLRSIRGSACLYKERDMSKKKTGSKAATVDSALGSLTREVIDQLLLDIDSLKAEVTANKARIELIVEGLKFVANESRVQYGLAGLALSLDAVVAKLAH